MVWLKKKIPLILSHMLETNNFIAMESKEKLKPYMYVH